MKKIFIILITGLMIFISCKTEKKRFQNHSSDSPKVNEPFQSFLDQFPEIKLPLTIKACHDSFSNLIKLEKKIDLLNRKEQNYIVGKIKVNEESIAVITLEEAECYIPILTTFKLNGKKINSEKLMIGLCGSDTCFECEEIMKIDNELNIYVGYTGKYFECDENKIYKNRITEEKTISKNGKIETNGKIKFNQ